MTIGTLLGFIYLLNYVTNPTTEITRHIAQSLVDKASSTLEKSYNYAVGFEKVIFGYEDELVLK